MSDYLNVLAINLGLAKDKTLETNMSKNKQVRNLSTVLLFIIYFVFTSHFLGTVCPIQASTGFPCPTCGSTRAFSELVRGNCSAAFFYHPLIILSLVILAAGLLYGLHNQVQVYRATLAGKSIARAKSPKWILIAMVIIIVLYLGVYLYRMINFYPNVAPMEYNYSSVWGRVWTIFNT